MPLRVTTWATRGIKTDSCPTYEDAFTAAAKHLRELERAQVPTRSVRVLILVNDQPEDSSGQVSV